MKQNLTVQIQFAQTCLCPGAKTRICQHQYLSWNSKCSSKQRGGTFTLSDLAVSQIGLIGNENWRRPFADCHSYLINFDFIKGNMQLLAVGFVLLTAADRPNSFPLEQVQSIFNCLCLLCKMSVSSHQVHSRTLVWATTLLTPNRERWIFNYRRVISTVNVMQTHHIAHMDKDLSVWCKVKESLNNKNKLEY